MPHSSSIDGKRYLRDVHILAFLSDPFYSEQFNCKSKYVGAQEPHELLMDLKSASAVFWPCN